MKIVFDARVHLNYYSGISRYIICLLEAYATLFPKDQITVLLNPTIAKDNSIYNTLNPFENISFKVVNAGHMGPKNYLLMGRIIKRLSPDVYHYPHLDAPIFTGNIPVVATVHDSNSNKNIKKFDDRFGLKSIYFKTALRTTLRKANQVIFVSNSIKKEILQDFKLDPKQEKFHCIHNGFEPHFNQITPEKAANIRKEMNCNQRPYILFVGQIREHKNIFRSVEAFKQFSKGHPEYDLVIVGHNYLNLQLDEERITHFEKVSNETLKALYEGCTAFLFPSLFEGFGFPILEAFSFGKPVITSSYGATKEVGAPYAQLVDPLSVKAIEEGLKNAVMDTKNADNRVTHSLKFSWKENAKALRNVYLKAIQSI